MAGQLGLAMVQLRWLLQVLPSTPHRIHAAHRISVALRTALQLNSAAVLLFLGVLGGGAIERVKTVHGWRLDVLWGDDVAVCMEILFLHGMYGKYGLNTCERP